MIQSQISHTARQALTDLIIAAKAEKNLSFEQIAQGTGLSDVFVTAAVLKIVSLQIRRFIVSTR